MNIKLKFWQPYLTHPDFHTKELTGQPIVLQVASVNQIHRLLMNVWPNVRELTSQLTVRHIRPAQSFSSGEQAKRCACNQVPAREEALRALEEAQQPLDTGFALAMRSGFRFSRASQMQCK